MGFFGSLVGAGVKAVGGGLRGQNEGDDELYKRHRQEREDRRAEEHYQSDYLLRKYAAERQSAEDARRAAHERRIEGHYDYEEQPEWKRLGYGSQEAWDASVHRPPMDHDHTDRRPEWQKNGYPSFEAWRQDQRDEHAGSRSGQAGEDIKNLNSVVDDEDRTVGRLDREVPKPWDPGMLADSASYTDSRDAAIARRDSATARRDRFSSKRNDLVARQFGIDSPPSSSEPGQVDPASLSSGAGHGRRPPPVAAPAGAAHPPGWRPATQPAPTEDTSARMTEINRQYQEALQWRGPNGERKDPAALKQRYLEAMAEAAGQ